MTATFVDGEFMVPVRDHPMAAKLLAYAIDQVEKTISVKVFALIGSGRQVLTLTGVDHWRTRYRRSSGTFPEDLRNIFTGTLRRQVCSPTELPSPARASKRGFWPGCLQSTLHLLSRVQQGFCHTFRLLV